MDFHDPFLVFNLNIIIALTILVVAVTVFILYSELREKEKSRQQERNSFESMMFENVRDNRLRQDERKKRGQGNRFSALLNKLRTHITRLRRCR